MKIRIHQSLLIACDAQDLHLYDIFGGEPVLVASRSEPSDINPFGEDPTGERVTRVQSGLFARSFTDADQEGHWSARHTQVGLYDLSLNEVARFSTGQRLDETSLALSPDGARLASVQSGGGPVIFDARTGEVRHSHEGHMGSAAAWSPDGRTLAAGDSGQGGGELYLLDLDAEGTPSRRALPRPTSGSPLYDSPYCAGFSPDGALVAFTNAAWGSRGVTVYEVVSGQERWSIKTGMLEESEDEEFWFALELDFALGGSVLLVGIEEGLQAYRTKGGAPLSALPCEGSTTQYFAADDLRRRVWFTNEEGLAWESYPEDW